MDFKSSKRDIQQIQNFLMDAKFKLKKNTKPLMNALPNSIKANAKKFNTKKYMRLFSSADQMKIKKLLPFFSEYTENGQFQLTLASYMVIKSNGDRSELTKQLKLFKQAIRKSTGATKGGYIIATIITMMLWTLLMVLQDKATATEIAIKNPAYIIPLLALFAAGLYFGTKNETDASGDATIRNPKPSGNISKPEQKKKSTASSDEFLL
jgi:hypothetical protein